MTKATRQDKHLVIEILFKAFNNNQSVNYIIQQDQKRQQRIRSLMNYSFELCYLFGDVFLSNDKKACTLILYPDKKKVTLKTLLLDLQLILTAVGTRNIRKAMVRESMINSIHPKGLKSYLWFIGVHPSHQQQGIGSILLMDIIKHSEQESRSVYLETSTLMNLPWYQNFGFTVYHQAELGYQLFFLKRDLGVQ
jgi:hypothetical protein